MINTRKYNIDARDQKELQSIILMDDELRKKLLGKYLREHGSLKLINLFSQFIGMANSVVANCHDTANESVKKYVPAEMSINMPSLLGACYGAKNARLSKLTTMCDTCAFRIGTIANQSESTQLDMEECGMSDGDFLCHEKDHKCIGYASIGKPQPPSPPEPRIMREGSMPKKPKG